MSRPSEDHDIIYRLDSAGNITFVNDAVGHYGFSAEELIGTPILDLVHPNDRDRAAYRINERRTGDRSTKSLRVRLVPKQGAPGLPEKASEEEHDGFVFLIRAEGLYRSELPQPESFTGTWGIARNIDHWGDAPDQKEEPAKLLSLILETLPHPLYLIDADTRRIIMTNSVAHPGKALKDTCCYALFHRQKNPCHLSGEICPLERTKETKRPTRVEHIHYDKVGNPRNVAVYAHPVLDDKGDVTQILQYAMDITEHTRDKQAVREGHAYAESIVETLREPLVLLDADLRVFSANRSFYRKFQVSREETEGRYLYDLGNRQWDIPELRQMLEEILSENTSFEDFEVEDDFQSLGRKIMVLNARRVCRGGNETRLILLTIEDVTEGVQAERALQRSEERYRRITETITDYIYSVNVKDGRPCGTTHGPGCVAVTGYTAEEFKENPHLWIEMVHDEDRAAVEKQAKKILSGKQVKPLDHRIVCKDGTIRWVRNTPVPQFDAKGRLLPYDGVIQDISERKRLEGQLHEAQRMEAIGTLAGGITHDFNNLLLAIQGNTTLMLLDTDPAHPHYERLKSIEESVQSGAELTRQLLGFARGGKYEVKPTDLNELIKKQNRIFGRARKEISVRGKYEEDLWTVEVDQAQIEQVLLNLYVNGVDAMPEGGTLQIQTENVILDETSVKRFPFEVKPGKYVSVEVTDTGVGMDEATQERIFDPFFTTKEIGHGTGLGLASAYGIIKNHGGIIVVESVKGEGTTFHIYLPASEKEVVKEVRPREEVISGKENILVVDDEDVTTDLVLKTLGYNVSLARSGKDAVKILKEKKDKIDIVILDMIMPGMGGSETYEQLKKVKGDIKVLLSSGYSIEGQATKILEKGCDGFIQKPFKMKELSTKIREILDRG